MFVHVTVFNSNLPVPDAFFSEIPSLKQTLAIKQLTAWTQSEDNIGMFCDRNCGIWSSLLFANDEKWSYWHMQQSRYFSPFMYCRLSEAALITFESRLWFSDPVPYQTHLFPPVDLLVQSITFSIFIELNTAPLRKSFQPKSPVCPHH